MLNIESGVATFGGVKVVSFEMTKESLCCINQIHLSSGINLGNECTLMPGTPLSTKIMVGSLILVTRETVSRNINEVLLGIPARGMPFVMSDSTSMVNILSLLLNSLSLYTLLTTCISFFMSKCIIIILYSLLPVSAALFIHIIIF